jgi:hypothetical protein
MEDMVVENCSSIIYISNESWTILAEDMDLYLLSLFQKSYQYLGSVWMNDLLSAYGIRANHISKSFMHKLFL